MACSLPWAITYHHHDSLAPLGIALHPTLPYEIIYLAIIFGVVLKVKDRLKPDGSLFLLYLSLYSLWRFVIDFLREGTPFLLGLHQAQVIAIITLAITLPLLYFRTQWVKRESEAD